MIHHEREMTHLVALANDLARDDKATTAMLALLRNGHPGSNIHGAATPRGDDPGEPPYGDPTGEAAIQPDHAVDDGRTYTTAIAQAIALLALADAIRQRCIARTSSTVGIGRDPGHWCRNHLKHGYAEPAREGHPYCNWCTNQKTYYSVFPDAEVLSLRNEGRRTDKAMNALARKRPA